MGQHEPFAEHGASSDAMGDSGASFGERPGGGGGSDAEGHTAAGDHGLSRYVRRDADGQFSVVVAANDERMAVARAVTLGAAEAVCLAIDAWEPAAAAWLSRYLEARARVRPLLLPLRVPEERATRPPAREGTAVPPTSEIEVGMPATAVPADSADVFASLGIVRPVLDRFAMTPLPDDAAIDGTPLATRLMEQNPYWVVLEERYAAAVPFAAIKAKWERDYPPLVYATEVCELAVTAATRTVRIQRHPHPMLG